MDDASPGDLTKDGIEGLGVRGYGRRKTEKRISRISPFYNVEQLPFQKRSSFGKLPSSQHIEYYSFSFSCSSPVRRGAHELDGRTDARRHHKFEFLYFVTHKKIHSLSTDYHHGHLNVDAMYIHCCQCQFHEVGPRYPPVKMGVC